METKMENDKYTILIADDSETDVELLLEGVATEERNLVNVFSGNAVLEYVEKNIPDLILLDVMMPGLDGYEVCSRLKKNLNTRHIPIIFLTSLTDTDDIARGLELGAVDYIVKPYNLNEINARIKNHLDLQKRHEYSLALLKGFASSISDAAIMMEPDSKILEVFGNYSKYFPELTQKSSQQKLVDILPDFLNKQFLIALDTLLKTKEVFEFETEAVVEDQKCILQITMSIVSSQSNKKEVVSAKILDVTNRRIAERKVDLTYEYQKRSRFFNSVLTGGYSEEQQNQLLSIYGIENQKSLVCYVLSTSFFDTNVLTSSNIRSSIGEWLIEKGYGWIWNSNFGVGILMQYPSSTSEIEKVALLLKESLEMRFPNIITHVGAASTDSTSLNFKQLYYDALAALMMAIDENREYVVAEDSQSGLYELIVHAIEHMDVDRFAEQVLGKINRHDIKNGSDLLNTLEQLIIAPSIKAVAAHLFIHSNTVLWRKQKIEEILECSLEDINVRTKINLAFKLMNIRNFTKKTNEFFPLS